MTTAFASHHRLARVANESRESRRLGAEALGKLVDGLCAKDAWAERELLLEFGPVVEGTLVRVLGSHRDLPDLVQEVFLRTIERVGDLREPAALPGFVRSIAVFVARETIRARRRKRWLSFLAPAELPEPIATTTDAEARSAVRAFYAIVDRMCADDQVVFTLRYVEGLELLEVADRAGLSLSTVKRRLTRAEAIFVPAARADEELESWLAQGGRWT